MTCTLTNSADASGCGGARVRGGLDRADVAADHDGDEPAADPGAADQGHVGGLDHGVGGLMLTSPLVSIIPSAFCADMVFSLKWGVR